MTHQIKNLSFLLLVTTISSLPIVLGFNNPVFSRYSVEIYEETPTMSNLLRDGYKCQRSGGDYICTKKDNPTYVCDGEKCEKLPYPF